MSAMRRRVRAALVALTMAAGLVVSLPSAAHAAANVSDGFEHLRTREIWDFDLVGADSAGNIEIPSLAPRSGSNAAWVTTSTGWAGVARTVFIGDARQRCWSLIHVNPFSIRTRVRFEIIDPVTWTYIALLVADLAPDAWRGMGIGSFTTSGPNIYVRLTVTNELGIAFARVDDLRLVCENLPIIR